MTPQFREISKPIEGEYAPYAMAYISLAPDENVLSHIQQNNIAVKWLIASLSEETLNAAYAPGKWTLKEVLGHMIDTERIFCYRALCIARGEKAMLPGFDENQYAQQSNARDREIEEIMTEYDSVRQSTITLFNSFSDDMLLRLGTANNVPVSVRALIYQIAGHELHHINVIKERYLP